MSEPSLPFRSRILQRQLRKHLGAAPELPAPVTALLRAVDDYYEQQERDRHLVDRAMKLSSDELTSANDQLRRQNERNTEVLDRLRELARSLRHDATSPHPVPGSDDQSDALELFGIIADLVQRRQEAEARLRAALQEAEDANRAKGEFLATMSHEIRTPLNGVIGFADLLLHSELTEQQRRHATLLKKSGEALVVIIDDILDFAKIEAGKLTLEVGPYDADLGIQEALELLQPTANAKHLLLTEGAMPSGQPRVLADRGRMRQVLVNLIGNALKFTPRGTVLVDLFAHDDTLPPPLQQSVGTLRPGELLFAVTDSGIGISAETMARLFQKFSQADSSTTRRYGGTGLGLAISKRLVELMGGRIGVTSREHAGSTFWFTLPRADVAPPRSSRPDSGLQFKIAPLKINGRAPQILLVDDIPINREVAMSALTLLGCATATAANGREAIAAWQAGSFDAILMDCLMPELDGFAATARIREKEAGAPERGRIPIIAVTANAMNEDQEKCRAAGMDAFLAKPLRTADIRGVLERLFQT